MITLSQSAMMFVNECALDASTLLDLRRLILENVRCRGYIIGSALGANVPRDVPPPRRISSVPMVLYAHEYKI
jgi:hypothetical protein